jgi:hypothetical protein
MKISSRRLLIFGSFMLCLCAMPFIAIQAQESLSAAESEPTNIEQLFVDSDISEVQLDEGAVDSAENSSAEDSDSEPELAYRKQPISVASIPPTLFTKWEYEAILDAIRSRGKTKVRTPTSRELRDSEGVEEERYRVRPPPEERDITLNGLVYGGKDDWTIWLNGKRVTPNAIPEEVTDLRVYKEYIEMKWYDEYSQSVYPIRLRPSQRFNLDTRIFLPG